RECSSSTCKPNVIVPRQILETCRPLLPNRTCCMVSSLSVDARGHATKVVRMRYHRLGRTALRVSHLCLGTMNLAPQTSAPYSFAIMDRALELGINFFDTATRYGGSLGAGATESI